MLIADKFFNRNFSKSECQNPYQAHIRDQAEIKKQKHSAASIRTASDLHFSLQFAFLSFNVFRAQTEAYTKGNFSRL